MSNITLRSESSGREEYASQKGCCENLRWVIITAVALVAIALLVSGGLLYYFSILNLLYSSCMMGSGGLLILGLCITGVVLACRSSSEVSAQTSSKRVKSIESTSTSKPSYQPKFTLDHIKYAVMHGTQHYNEEYKRQRIREKLQAMSGEDFQAHLATIEAFYCERVEHDYGIRSDEELMISEFWSDSRTELFSFEKLYLQLKQCKTDKISGVLNLMGEEVYKRFVISLYNDLNNEKENRPEAMLLAICGDSKFFECPFAMQFIAAPSFAKAFSDRSNFIIDLVKDIFQGEFAGEKQKIELLKSIFKGLSHHVEKEEFSGCLDEIYALFAAADDEIRGIFDADIVHQKMFLSLLSGQFFSTFTHRIVQQYSQDKEPSSWQPASNEMKVLFEIVVHESFLFKASHSQRLKEVFNQLVTTTTQNSYCVALLLLRMSAEREEAFKDLLDYIFTVYQNIQTQISEKKQEPEQLVPWIKVIDAIGGIILRKKEFLDADNDNKSRYVQFTTCIIDAYSKKETMPWKPSDKESRVLQLILNDKGFSFNSDAGEKLKIAFYRLVSTIDSDSMNQLLVEMSQSNADNFKKVLDYTFEVYQFIDQQIIENKQKPEQLTPWIKVMEGIGGIILKKKDFLNDGNCNHYRFKQFVVCVVDAYTRKEERPWKPTEQELNLLKFIFTHEYFSFTSGNSTEKYKEAFNLLVTTMDPEAMNQLLITMSQQKLETFKSAISHITEMYDGNKGKAEQLAPWMKVLESVNNILYTNQKINFLDDGNSSHYRFKQFVVCVVDAYTRKEERPWKPTEQELNLLKFIFTHDYFSFNCGTYGQYYKVAFNLLVTTMDPEAMKKLLIAISRQKLETFKSAISHITEMYDGNKGKAEQLAPWMKVLESVNNILYTNQKINFLDDGNSSHYRFKQFVVCVVDAYTKKQERPWQPTEQELNLLKFIFTHEYFSFTSGNSTEKYKEAFNLLVTTMDPEAMNQLLITMSQQKLETFKSAISHITEMYDGNKGKAEQLAPWMKVLESVSGIIRKEGREDFLDDSNYHHKEFTKVIMDAYEKAQAAGSQGSIEQFKAVLVYLHPHLIKRNILQEILQGVDVSQRTLFKELGLEK